jgi:DNA-directed RNA polymerase specialized sigma24 family protein
VVVLRYYFDLPEADVAAELGVTIGAVKSMASRALARLRVRTDQIADPSAARTDPGAWR